MCDRASDPTQHDAFNRAEDERIRALFHKAFEGTEFGSTIRAIEQNEAHMRWLASIRESFAQEGDMTLIRYLAVMPSLDPDQGRYDREENIPAILSVLEERGSLARCLHPIDEEREGLGPCGGFIMVGMHFPAGYTYHAAAYELHSRTGEPFVI